MASSSVVSRSRARRSACSGSCGKTSRSWKSSSCVVATESSAVSFQPADERRRMTSPRALGDHSFAGVPCGEDLAVCAAGHRQSNADAASQELKVCGDRLGRVIRKAGREEGAGHKEDQRHGYSRGDRQEAEDFDATLAFTARLISQTF